MKLYQAIKNLFSRKVHVLFIFENKTDEIKQVVKFNNSVTFSELDKKCEELTPKGYTGQWFL